MPLAPPVLSSRAWPPEASTAALMLEAPDPATITKLTIELSARGSASFEVLSAIPVEELIASGVRVMIGPRLNGYASLST